MALKITSLSSFFITFFFSLNTFAQAQITVSGFVTDSASNLLVGAHVRDNHSGLVTVTDEQGRFTIQLSEASEFLLISHVGYLPKSIELNIVSADSSRDGYRLDPVILTPSYTHLSQVDISAAPDQPILGRFNYFIYDYQFFDGRIILAVKENDQYKLQQYSMEMQLVQEAVIPFKPERLYTDCFGFVHVLSKDSIYQMDISKRIVLPYAYPVAMYQNQLKNCVAAGEGYLVFQQYGEFNKRVTYNMGGQQENESKPLRSVFDEKADRLARNQVEDFERYLRMSFNRVPPWNYLRRMPYNCKPSQFSIKNIQEPVYHPLLQVQNKYYLFDHLSDTCFVYSAKGELEKKFPLQHHLNSNWDEKLLEDPATGKVYAVYKEDGIVSFAEIDLSTGALAAPVKISSRIFPGNIRLFNGYAYYLYHEHTGEFNDKLYRQRVY